MRTISVKPFDALLVQLAAKARTMGVTKSYLMREGLKKLLAKQPPHAAISCYDLARDPADCIKGIPRNLADNPKYMEGCGE